MSSKGYGVGLHNYANTSRSVCMRFGTNLPTPITLPLVIQDVNKATAAPPPHHITFETIQINQLISLLMYYLLKR